MQGNAGTHKGCSYDHCSAFHGDASICYVMHCPYCPHYRALPALHGDASICCALPVLARIASQRPALPGIAPQRAFVAFNAGNLCDCRDDLCQTMGGDVCMTLDCCISPHGIRVFALPYGFFFNAKAQSRKAVYAQSAKRKTRLCFSLSAYSSHTKIRHASTRPCCALSAMCFLRSALKMLHPNRQ